MLIFTGHLAKFTIAESILESDLFLNPMIFSSTLPGELAKNFKTLDNHDFSADEAKKLYDAEFMFKQVIEKTDKPNLSMEANIVLIKLLYSQMRYDEAIKQLNNHRIKQVISGHLQNLQYYLQAKQLIQQQQSLQVLTNSQSLRQMQLYAELYSIRGLCLELKRKNEDTQRDDQDIIDSYELSSLFAIQHSLMLQQKYNSDNSPNNLNQEENLDLINPLYENAIQKAPLLYIKRG